MENKEIDPSDIGKYPELIKKAQKEMANSDIFVCGNCHMTFNFIQEFQTHKDDACDRESTLKNCKDPKPKVWAFLLWKSSHLNNAENRKPNTPAWTLYQKWVKMDESVRETWIVAGKTIQSFVKMGQGNLHEMPVKITKTVVDSVGTKNQENQKAPSPAARYAAARVKNATNPLAEKSDNESKDKPVRVTPVAKATPLPPPAPEPVVKSVALKTKLAKRTMGDQAVIEHEVEKILAKRFNPRRKIHEYLVKWDKVPHDQNSWEPFTHLGNVKHLVDVFEVQLAKQKEQRGLTQLAAAKPALAPPPIRQDRNAKTNALDQVSKWLTDEDGIGKRKNPDDSDYSDEEDISELDVSSPKKAKLDMSSSSSVVSDKARTSASKVNGTAQKKVDENSAEVVLTKGTKSTGVVRKPGPATSSPAAQAASPNTSQVNEAQVRIVQKGEESVPTGVVRIIPSTSPKRVLKPQMGGAQKSTSGAPKVVTTATTNNLVKSLPSSTTIRQVQKPTSAGITPPKVVTTAKQVVGGKKIVTTSRTTHPSSSTTTTTVGRTTVMSRTVKSSPVSQLQSSSEQKIMSLSRQGSLRVVKRSSPAVAPERHSKESDDDDGMEDLFPKTINTEIDTNEEELPLTLCPLTGQVLSQAEGEPEPTKEEDEENADPAEVQQLLTNEDGTPLIVTGEDGTIYQVAGKNANGQTVLIAQGGEGEQPVVLLANDGEDNEGIQFQASDTVQLSAQQTVAGAEMETEEGGEVTAGEEGGVPENQQLTIQTEGEEGQITAEIVQAELPSPGGTRRVVLLLPDGSLMMTEVNEEQYQSLNLNS